MNRCIKCGDYFNDSLCKSCRPPKEENKLDGLLERIEEAAASDAGAALFEIGQVEFEDIKSFYDDSGRVVRVEMTKQYGVVAKELTRLERLEKNIKWVLSNDCEMLYSDKIKQIRSYMKMYPKEVK